MRSLRELQDLHPLHRCIGASAGDAWVRDALLALLLIVWFHLCMVTGNCFVDDPHRHAYEASYWYLSDPQLALVSVLNF